MITLLMIDLLERSFKEYKKMSDYSISYKITADDSGFQAVMTNVSKSLSGFGQKISDSTKKVTEGAKNWGLDLNQFYNKGSSIFKQFGIDVDKFASHFGMSGALMTGIVAVTTALNKLGEEMNKMSGEIVKGTGKTGEALRQLEEDAGQALINGVGAGAQEVGQIIANLNTRFATTGEEAVKLTDSFDQLSAVFGVDASDAVNSVADAIKKWGLNTEDAIPLLDQLTVGSQESGASLNELLSGLTSGQAIFSQFGMSVTDSIAFLGSLSAEGVDASSALTGMRTALAKFSTEGKDAGQAFQEVSEAIRNADTQTEALAIATETFGTRSGAEMVRVLQSSSESANSLAEKLQQAGGALSVTDANSRTAKDALDDLTASLQGTFRGFGQGVNELFKDIIDSVTEFMNLIAPIVEPLGLIFRDVFSFIGELIKTLVGFFVEFQKRYNVVWQSVVDILSSVYKSFHSILGNVLSIFQDVFGLVFAILGKDWGLAWAYTKRILLNAVAIIANHLSGLVNVFSGAINGIIRLLNGLIDGFNDLIKTINLIPGIDIPLAQKLSEIGEVNFAEDWGINEAIAEVTAEIDEMTGKTTEQLVGSLGEIKDTSFDVAEDVAEGWDTAFSTMRSSAQTWEDKIENQQIKMLKKEQEHALERARLEGKTDAEILEIKKGYLKQIADIQAKQLEEEKQAELDKLDEIEKTTGVTEETEKLRFQINKYYSTEITNLYEFEKEKIEEVAKTATEGAKEETGAKQELIETEEELIEAKDKASGAEEKSAQRNYTWEKKLLEQENERLAKVDENDEQIYKNKQRLIEIEKIEALARAESTDEAGQIDLYYNNKLNDLIEERAKLLASLGNKGAKADGGSASDISDAEIKALEEVAQAQQKWAEKLEAQRQASFMADKERNIQRAKDYGATEEEIFAIQKHYADKELAYNLAQIEQEKQSALGQAKSEEEKASIVDFYNLKSAESYKKYQDEICVVSRDASEEMEENLKSTWSKFSNIVSVVTDKMKTAFKGVFDFTVKIFKGIGNVISSLWSGFIKALDFNPDDALDSLLAFEDKILTFFIETLPKIPQFLASALQSIGVLLNTLLENVDFSAIGDMLADAFVSALDMLPALVTQVTKLITKLVKSLPSIINKVVPNITRAFIGIVKAIPDILPSMVQAFTSIIDQIIRVLPDMVNIALPNLINGLVENLPTLINGLMTLINSLLDQLPRILGMLVDGITNIVVDLLRNPEKLLDLVFKLIDVIARIPFLLLENAGKIVGAFIQAIPQLLAKIFSELPRMIGEAIRNALSAIGGFFSWVWAGIKGIFGFANGTDNAPRGLAIVGEAGPELVNFRGGEQVINNRNTQKALQGISSGTNNFNVTFNNLQDTTAFAMMQQLKAYNRNMAINGII